MKNLRDVRCIAAMTVLVALTACASVPRSPVRAGEAARFAAFESSLRPIVLEPGQASPHWTLAERMAHYQVPGVAVAIVRDGKVAHVRGYGVRDTATSDEVDGDTLFSTGSISKVTTATIALRLVEQGTLSLDRDIDAYLRRWHVPDAPQVTRGRKPTLRMLMSHIAGLGVHGFKDFAPGEALPSLLQTLDGQTSAQRPVRYEYEPGTRMQYSGGGVMVEQLVLEDATGRDFSTLAQSLLFDPLRMRRSTFENPLSAVRGNIAKAYTRDGTSAVGAPGWQSMPEQAASGMWSSANDLGAFVAALIGSYRADGGLLTRATARDMMTVVTPSEHGLGPRLRGAGATRIFHHGGDNDSYKSWIEGNLVTGDGIVILTNGGNGADLYDEIRNAASDAFGWPVNAPVRTVAMDADVSRYGDYAGVYRLEPAFLAAQRIAPSPKNQRLEFALAAGAATLQIGERKPTRLLALTPNRFVAPDVPVPAGTLQIEFHRDADGRVYALTFDAGGLLTFYTREPATEPAR